MTTNEIEMTTDKLIKSEVFTDEVTKKWVKSCLQTNICTITFTKKNGDERVMKCTLDEQHFPPVQREASEVSEFLQPAKESFAVFDVEAQGWRAFRWDSIKRFEMTL